MTPSEFLKKNLKDSIETKKISETGFKQKKEYKFYQRGRDYCVDEVLIGKLYDVYNQVKKETNINDYEEKKEIKFAYPGFFSFEQQQNFYKVTKK